MEFWQQSRREDGISYTSRGKKRMKATRVMKGILLFFCLSILLVGCGSRSADSSNDKTLTLLVEGGGPAFEVASKTAAQFEEQTGYKIKIDSVPYSGVYDKLKAEIDAKKSTHDVAIIDVLWFPSLAKGLEPLGDVLTAEQMNDFLPQLNESATINEELLGIPTWTNSKILLYRKDLFEDPKNQADFKQEFGYDLKAPANWHEYADVAKFFTKDGMYGVSVFGQTGGDAVSSWLDHVTQAGVDSLILDENGEVNITGEPYVQALAFLQNLVQEQVVPEDYLSIASSETAELFNNGKLAMQLAWGHFYLSSDQALPGQVGAAPMIAGADGVGAVPGPWYQVVLKDSPKKDIAAQYIKFMYEQNELYMESLGVAARKSVFDKYKDNPQYAHVKAIEATLNGAQTQNRPQIAQWSQIENEVLSPMLQKVLSGSDPATELDLAKKQIEEILGR
ncbi:ABC transporter substrate-binding protein [Paenibacillus sanguinis]|uniref:ABC transporter substrate-binding protein n=1 Tax=Paenibacillus sanguinis TaxID=225906 RepID=UPI00035F4A42|nr:sugar ABC transporter substrate-binding protein [Paenibacillus sanguinis]